jgi:hypothetical protein
VLVVAYGKIQKEDIGRPVMGGAQQPGNKYSVVIIFQDPGKMPRSIRTGAFTDGVAAA